MSLANPVVLMALVGLAYLIHRQAVAEGIRKAHRSALQRGLFVELVKPVTLTATGSKGVVVPRFARGVVVHDPSPGSSSVFLHFTQSTLDAYDERLGGATVVIDDLSCVRVVGASTIESIDAEATYARIQRTWPDWQPDHRQAWRSR